MFSKWQLVVLGLVVSQGFNLSASEKAKSSPRTPLSCSEEARKERSSESRKKEQQMMALYYYDSPCGSGRAKYYDGKPKNPNPMAPWVPDFPGQNPMVPWAQDYFPGH